MTEWADEWVPLRAFPKYCVNPLGQVMHARTERIVRPQVNQQGVAYVSLVRETSHQFKRSLALLVAREFILPPGVNFDTPINMDGDRLNCAVSNLVWRPRWFAQQFHRQFKERTHPITQPVRDLDAGRVFRDGIDACINHGLIERDLLLSIMNHTVAWPLMHRFDVD